MLPLYIRGDRKKIFKALIGDIEEQLRSRGLNEIPYTIKTNHLKECSEVSREKVSRSVRSFLESQGKKYEIRRSSYGTRYIINARQEELEEWRKALNL